MYASPAVWRARESADYDSLMSAKASQVLREITFNRELRRALLHDPCVLHQELFREFAPEGYAIYAGNYRGMAKTSLFDRTLVAQSLFDPGVQYSFCPPNEVYERISVLMSEARGFVKCRELDDDSKLLALSYVFCWIGRIQPFLDGNGHVQRAVFAAMAVEYGFGLSPKFTIHPAPYGRLFAIASELFARAEIGKEVVSIPLAAEYLCLFLVGQLKDSVSAS